MVSTRFDWFVYAKGGKFGNSCSKSSCSHSYADLSAFFKAANIAGVSKMSYQRLSKKYVWPSVKEYYENQKPIVEGLADLALDGAFDSPGHNAQYCSETCMDRDSKLVMGCEIVRKEEVDGISNRMELRGVQKLFEKLGKDNVNSVTIDKHLQICKWLRENNVQYYFDPWHHLKTNRKKIRKARNVMKHKNKAIEKWQLEVYDNLSKRLIKHLYSAVELSAGNPDLLKEIALSYFLHVAGCHEWKSRSVAELIYNLRAPDDWKKSKFDPRSTLLANEKFGIHLKCTHVHNQEDITPAVDPTSLPFIELLKMVSNKTFLQDLLRLKHGNVTANVESFHSISIHYRPKRKFYNPPGFTCRTMLAIISYNENVRAEQRGERKVVEEYRYFSKSKGEFTTKFKKGAPIDAWKEEIVIASIDKKLHPDLDEPVFEENDIDDGIESIHDEDESLFGEGVDEELFENEESEYPELENENLRLKFQEEYDSSPPVSEVSSTDYDTPSPSKSIKEPKKSIHRLRFSDDEDEEDE
uniref:Uncharacterized protein n=1 Tax=Acrobeloides nanus TaxID=290746 RepID=A0A914CS80_9BILA